MNREATKRDEVWDRLFDVQYETCQQIDELIRENVKYLPPDWRSFVHLYVIEHLAESARFSIEPTPPRVSEPS